MFYGDHQIKPEIVFHQRNRLRTREEIERANLIHLKTGFNDLATTDTLCARFFAGSGSSALNRRLVCFDSAVQPFSGCFVLKSRIFRSHYLRSYHHIYWKIFLCFHR